jgi:MinD-like ATPase involved in chromosome partitioning or flagellar assembly
MSSIIAFYSYKGGVGRSMALANIAVLLAQRGLKVLAVDWDLEAPGLERYFSYFSTTASGAGLMRMLMAARDGEFTEFASFTSSIDCGTSHPLTLLTSGREQDDNYSLNLEAFDWSEFFAQGGGAFLERLREEWRQTFDIVLIDSRTGLSDTGGICTIQLPDAVVAMFTANHQSLYGVRDVIRLAQKARQSLAYDRMPLSVLPLPSRWGVQEFQETQIWLDRVAEGVQEFYADWLPRPFTPRQIAESIKIPHHSYFGFGERLAVAEQGTTDPTGLGFVYDKVAAFLASDFKDLATLVGEQAAKAATFETPVLQSFAPTPSDYEYDVFVSYDGSMSEWVAEFVRNLRANLDIRRPTPSRIFTDIREVAVGSYWEQEISTALGRSKVMLALVTPRYFRSTHTVQEFQTFVERSRLTSGRVLLPVVLSGDSFHFPDFFREMSWKDLRSLPQSMLKGPSSRRSSEWFRAITDIAETVDRMIDEAPPLDPGWPIANAPSSDELSPPVPLPRL